jgi:hypothetical protein
MDNGATNTMPPNVGSVRLVPAPPEATGLYERAVPQKDQLCGAFWGSLALTAGGYPFDQDEVALRAGTSLAEGDPSEWLPPGASSRTDYRVALPDAADEATSGTSAIGVARGIEDLSGSGLAAVPVAGPWSPERVVALVEIVAEMLSECTLIANLRTGRLWGSRPPAGLFFDHLLGRPVTPPPPDWDCGHFLSILGSVSGPGGTLLALRDTYRELGWGGYHLQPAEAVADALARGDGCEGGVLCACPASEAEALAGRLKAEGFEVRHWDNGTPFGEGER